MVDTYENRIGPRNGAQVVARAWTDPEYRARLLADGTAAIGEFGFLGAQGEHMVVVENTPDVHNLVVCTLCSCYPWPTLGLPPVWYKSAPYRARAVIEPRAVLREFGVELPDDVEVRVWDSNRRDPVPRAAGTPGRHGEPHRGTARRARHPRFDDRRRPGRGAPGVCAVERLWFRERGWAGAGAGPSGAGFRAGPVPASPAAKGGRE